MCKVQKQNKYRICDDFLKEVASRLHQLCGIGNNQEQIN